ncbi:uncharacterized protein LOC121725268 [Aricia agestis]|uniref:uncharacterized protein LOC121725268 n=1 Tax=Aricia agestis TaxID=91739 RepID=UPI001C203F88|nr:uncharacterized protein LOC121725268 [Aricia agestis]
MSTTSEDLSLSIYKYRSKKGKRDPLFFLPSFRRESDETAPNIVIEVDEENRQKTYAVLQERRLDFAHNKLRYALIIYCNPIWNLLVLSTIILNYIAETCLYTFIEELDKNLWLLMLGVFLNFVYIFDVVFVVGLKFFEKWRKTLNLVEPSTKRVIFDIVLALPYTFLYFIRSTNHCYNDFYAVAPIMATARVYRIIEYCCKKSSEAGTNQWTTFLAQYLTLFIISVHTWSCIWYMYSYKNFHIHRIRSSWAFKAMYMPVQTVFDWYFVCAYWSVMFFTTNALGDIYPVTSKKRVTATMAILIGFLLTTVVFVGSLTSLFITITTRRSRYVRQMRKIKNHLELIKMDDDTSKRILRYYNDLWYQKSGVFKPKLIKLLPAPLKMEIFYDLNAVPLFSSLIFRKLPEAFLRRLSVIMNHQFYLPGDIVYNYNQNKNSMVCVTNGVLELMSDEDDESPMISFTKGTCFGEITLIYNIPSRCTVKAATYLECQVLDKTDFTKLMITYPDIFEEVRNEIQERIRKCQVRKQRKDNEESLSLNIYASKGHKKSSIKCLKDKLRYLQGFTDTDNLTDEDRLDESCLNLYMISEHVKKRKDIFTFVNSKFPFILEADCPLVLFWQIYMLVIVLYISLFYPYCIGIERSFPGGLSLYIEVVISLSLFINVILTTSTAVKTKKKYITNFREILNYRMGTVGFYLDLFAIIPTEYIVTIHTNTPYYNPYKEHFFYASKGTKMVLIWRLTSFFEKYEKRLLSYSISTKIIKYCVYIILICYWSGILLYMESCFVGRCSDGSWFDRALMTLSKEKMQRKIQYPLLTSIYFATTTILSVGFGDFIPTDHYDMALIAFMSLYGVLFIGYCVSEFSAIITHYSRTKTAFLEVIITMDKFMRENHMHPAIKSRIMSFYELQWQYNSGVELTGENWLEKTIVPSELRKKVLHQARFKTLTSIKFFQVKNKAYIHTLTESARDIILPPGEIVYYGGTVTRELYIIESGYCVMTSRETNRVIGPGNHLGLLVLLYGVPAVNTVVTLTHCKLISINHFAYTSALNMFPEMREHENLLTPEELNTIEEIARTENTDGDGKKHNFLIQKLDMKRITNILQEFFDSSFIYLVKYYRQRGESYRRSYDKFKYFKIIAFYLLMPIAIRPDGIFIKVWANVRVITAYVLSLLIPIIVSMAPSFCYFDNTILALEILCYIDMYLMLHVAYYGPENQLIFHPYLTAKHYLKATFIIDFLTSFPWYVIWQATVSKNIDGEVSSDYRMKSHIYFCAVRMINVLQVYKLYAAFWAESIAALKRAYLMSVVQFFLLTIFFLNLYASTLIMLTCKYVLGTDKNQFTKTIAKFLLENRNYKIPEYRKGQSMICLKGSWIDSANIFKSSYLTPIKVYLLAYYWTAASFTSAGFGDISAQDTTHMIMSICIIVHGVLYFGYVYARIASLKAVADTVLTKFQEDLKHLTLFLNHEKVPFDLKRIIIDFWKYQWKRTGGWSHQKILGKLHSNLNEDAVLYMYEHTLRDIPLFEGVEYSFFRAFAKQLKECYMQKGYMVLRANEVISNMYIIYRGKVDIINECNEVEACMGPGGIFGNIKGMPRYLTKSNVVASRNIDLLYIDGIDFYLLLRSYPSVLRKVKYSVDSAQKDYVLPTMMSAETTSEVQGEHYSPAVEEEKNSEDEEDEGYMDSPNRSIAESHGSRSVTSISGADYTLSIWLIFLPHRWFRRSVIPDSMWIIFMDYLIIVMSYADFMMLVYQIAFQSNEYFFYICAVFDSIFLYKLFLDIHTGYVNRYGEYVLNPKKVRKMYFSKTYLRRRDFLANLPLCYFVFATSLHPNTQHTLFVYLRSPQLFRVSYLFTYRQHRKTNIGSANLFLKLATIATWTSLLTHVNACLFFKLSCLTPVQCVSENWMVKPELNLRNTYIEGRYFAIYITSLWYIINLLSITGTGDVSSRNDFEVIETIIITVTIKFCAGLLISEISSLITAHSSSRIAYDYGINELRDGLRDTDLSEHQMNKMWDYVRKLWNRQQGRQMPKLVHELPFRLRCQLMQEIYGAHIRDSIIFRHTDDDFKRMVTTYLRHCVFFPGNYIVQRGDADQCIYFIHRGEVEVLTVHQNLTESIYDVLGPEDSFGVAQGLYIGVVHYFSFRARTVVDVVYLKLDEWKYLMDFYPKSAKVVQKKVHNVYLAL